MAETKDIGSLKMNSAKPSLVGIAREDTVEESVRRSIELIGGIEFIKPGDTVLIKPNANTADPFPGSTNPKVLRSVIRMVKERSPKRVIIAEKSMIGLDTVQVLKTTGMYDVAREEAATVVSFDDAPWKQVNPEGAQTWIQGYSVSTLFDQVDHFITIPVAKTHWTATFTMALKAAIGLTDDLDRQLLPHGRNLDSLFGNMIAEANLAVQPDLIVMDATKSFVTQGPNIGTLKEPDMIFASKDLVANDVAGLSLLKVLGTIPKIQNKSVWKQPQIMRAVELGLGVKEPEQVHLRFHGVKEAADIRKHVMY